MSPGGHNRTIVPLDYNKGEDDVINVVCELQVIIITLLQNLQFVAAVWWITSHRCHAALSQQRNTNDWPVEQFRCLWVVTSFLIKNSS